MSDDISFFKKDQKDRDENILHRKGELDMNATFLENQFRHVEMILRVARVQEIFKDIEDLTNKSNTIAGGIGKKPEVFWNKNPRLACTMGPVIAAG